MTYLPYWQTTQITTAAPGWRYVYFCTFHDNCEADCPGWFAVDVAVWALQQTTEANPDDRGQRILGGTEGEDEPALSLPEWYGESLIGLFGPSADGRRINEVIEARRKMEQDS